MSQPSRWGFARLARFAAVLGAVALFGAARLAAQTTLGKIEGTVRDQAGAPIAGAQVLIVGSAFTSVTNEQGYYFINNVPAGVMTVRAQFIGYAPSETRNVRVFAGQTMTVDLALEQRAVEVGGVTVTVEQNPLVPRDQVTSKPIMSGDLIESLPADNLNQVLRLVPGVVEGTRGLVIRGGRPGEATFYIDGVEVRNLSNTFRRGEGNSGTVSVGTNAVEEASVTTGSIGVEFADAQSGVISLVTRAGGPNFRGTIGYSTDNLAGETYGQGTNRIEASIGGPLARNLTFFVGTVLQGQQNALRPRGAEDVPRFVLDGLDTSNPEAPDGYVMAPVEPGSATSDSVRVAIPNFTRYSSGSRLPDAWSNTLQANAKLQYTFGAGSRISLTYLRSRDQSVGLGFFNQYDPQAITGASQNSQAFILNWTQNLARSAERALFLEANASWQRDDYIDGDLLPGWYEDHRTPFGYFSFSGLQFLVNRDNFPIDDRLITNIRLGGSVCQGTRPIPGGTAGACTTHIGRQDLFTTGNYRTNPYGITPGANFFPSTGYADVNPTLARETRLTARVNVDWQADRYNRVRFGGDFMRANQDNWSSDMNEFFGLDAYRNTPSRIGFFGQDRLDLGDVVVELGLRWDHFDPDLMFPRTSPARAVTLSGDTVLTTTFARTYNDPLRQGDLSQAFTAADTAMGQRCGALNSLVTAGTATYADSVALSTCNFVQAPTRSRLSPSVRVSFPVTDRTGFRLSYSHQVQTPSFDRMAQRSNGDASYYNTNATYGSPVNFGRSILFEFGVRHAFSNDLVLDISAYNKDKVSDLAGRVVGFYDPFNGRLTNYNVLTNEDFGNVRGVDTKLDMRVGSLFQGSLAYTYQSARSTGSDPFEYINTISRQISTITQDRSPPPQALLATRDDRTHTIAGSATVTFPHGWRSGSTGGALLQDFGFFATFRFQSGLPYSRFVNEGNGQRGPGNNCGLVCTFAEPLNASRMPWIKNVDLRITRGLRLGADRDVTVFADFRNLFNFTNLIAIFAETGDTRNALHEEHQLLDVRNRLISDAGSLWVEEAVTRPDGSTAELFGVDLTDCSAYAYGSNGSRGTPDCLLLRGAERRWGNGDQFFDSEEIAHAYDQYYQGWSGPWTFRGPGLNFRLGAELHF